MNFEKEKHNKEAELEIAFEQRLKELLVHSEKVNEGSNAIIYHIDTKALNEEVKKAFFGKDTKELPDELAGKMLKMYLKGSGEKEATNHRKAYDLIDKNNPELAFIPEIYSHRDINVEDEELKDILEEYDINSSHVEILLMDYIKGEDFATYIFKQIIEKDPSNTAAYYRSIGILEGNVDFYKIHEAIAHILGYSSPTALQKVCGSEGVVWNKNSAIIEKYLENSNIVLDKKIFDKLTKTLQVLHENDIYHNDLHARNIMLTFNEDGSVDDVMLIDFADASVEKKEVDMSIVTSYRRFSATKEERKAKKFNKKFIRLEKLRERYMKNEKHMDGWNELEKKALNLFQEEESEEVYQELNNLLFTNDIFINDEKACFAMFGYLAKKEGENVLKFIDKKLQEKRLQKMQSWIDLKEYIKKI